MNIPYLKKFSRHIVFKKSSPHRHGEVFVLDDGGEVDLDLGNYERYLNITLTRENNITTGKIYKHVIERERRGDYLGHTVQVVPHITDAIQEWIERVARIPVDDTGEEPDVCILELGGTAGDIEGMPFVEALTHLRRRVGKGNFLQIHVSYIPLIHGEQKTKPTQQGIRGVRSAGLLPDLVGSRSLIISFQGVDKSAGMLTFEKIACRCEVPLEKGTVEKISHFCQVEVNQVISVRDMPSIYQVPVLLEQQGLVPLLKDILKIDDSTLSPALKKKGRKTWNEWNRLTSVQHFIPDTVNIALVGKYIELHDSYLSVIKALEHCAMRCNQKLNLLWVDAEHLEEGTRESEPANFHKAWHITCTADGILVPGGFGKRGTEGMIAAAAWARENKKPYLGICLGMQIAVIDFARKVCGLKGASSAEFDAGCEHPVVIYMPEIDKANMGGTMRLGLRPTVFKRGSGWSKLRALYEGSGGIVPRDAGVSSTKANGTAADNAAILERHRHRYEVNPEYIERIERGGRKNIDGGDNDSKNDSGPGNESTSSSNDTAGLSFIGTDESGVRMEIIELRDHPWYVGVQFHPEYSSRVLRPSKPFLGFVAASAGCLERITAEIREEGSRKGLVNGVGNGGDADTVKF